MILDRVENVGKYFAIDPRIKRGLELLNMDYSAISDGRYEVDGDRLFYMVQTYQTKSVNETPEAHKKYADIQYVLSDSECMEVCGLEELEILSEQPEKDLWTYRGPIGKNRICMQAGTFAVLWPQEIHAPAISAEDTELCHKVVIKILIDE